MTTRADIAQTTHRRLRSLASDAGLSYAAVDAQTEGSFTDAIDMALRSVGAVNADTDTLDVSLVTTTTFDTVIGVVTREMLVQLQLHYATLNDIKAGERDEKLSQIGAALRAIVAGGSVGGASASGRIVMKKLTRNVDDYEFS